MEHVANNMNDQFKQLMNAQTSVIEPLRIFATVTANAAEQIARKNHAVMGDILDFSTRQVKLPLTGENLTDVASVQIAEANTFVEQMKGRASEYADMAQQLSSKVQEASSSVTASFR